MLNHTSDQHAWFIEARSSRSHPRRDWYVWSDSDDETVAALHHFHRHRALELGLGSGLQGVLLAPVLRHQPDLNYDTPPFATRSGT